MSSTALYTTIYPGEGPYIKQWYNSVKQQTDNDFEIVIGLDDFTSSEIFECIQEELSAHFISAPKGSTPAQVREKAFDFIVQNFNQVIFTDSDDILHPARVEKTKVHLSEHDLCACALKIIDADGTDLNTIFPVGEKEELDSLLPRANIFGLSNTAYRCSLLEKLMPFPADCVMLDWFMVTKAWLIGANIKTSSLPLMNYRQHATNTARVLAPFNAKQITTACKLLKLHYSLLRKNILPDFKTKEELFTIAEDRLDKFITSMSVPEKKHNYIEELNKLDEEHIWWSWIAHPDLEEIWKS